MAASVDPRVSSPRPSGTAIRGGAIRVAGYVAGVLVSLGTAAILVRHLGISTFGRYVTVTSLLGVVGGVTEAGIYLFGIREFGSRSDADRRRLLASLLGLRLCLTLVGIGCAAAFALAVSYPGVLVLGALVVGAGLLAQVTADVLSVPLQARLELGRLTAIDVARRLAALALIAILSFVGAGLLPFFAASTMATCLALVILARTVRSSVTIRVSVRWREWRDLFSETLPFAIAASVGAIYIYVTVIVMSLLSTSKQTGLFAVSFRIIQVGIAIPVLLLTAVFPLMSRNSEDQAPKAPGMLGRVFTVSLICGVWMSIAVALGAGFIVNTIAQRQGHGAIPVLRIQALLLLLSFVSTGSALALISLRRYRTMLIASSCALALNILLGLALVPPLGARGGAWADVLAEALVAAGLTTMVRRTVAQHEIGFGIFVRIGVAAALSSTVLLLPIGDVAHVIGATVIYFGALSIMRAIPIEIIDAARGLRPPRAAS
jgi:O-antigen/teichoic acid export membrane protein